MKFQFLLEKSIDQQQQVGTTKIKIWPKKTTTTTTLQSRKNFEETATLQGYWWFKLV